MMLELFDPQKDDLAHIVVIEQASFPQPWTRKDFEEILALDSVRIWCIKKAQRVVAYMVWQFFGDEAELHNIAVDASYRSQGIARFMMEQFFLFAGHKEIKKCYLQVRESNKNAQNLYYSFDFRVVGVRAAYYSDGGEDALIMARTLDYLTV